MIYVWKCKHCEVEVEVTRSMAECKEPPGREGEDSCPCLLKEFVRVYTPAMITKASYPDGVRKFTELREAHKLERESKASRSSETKKEIAAEIKKMGVRIKK